MHVLDLDVGVLLVDQLAKRLGVLGVSVVGDRREARLQGRQ